MRWPASRGRPAWPVGTFLVSSGILCLPQPHVAVAAAGSQLELRFSSADRQEHSDRRVGGAHSRGASVLAFERGRRASRAPALQRRIDKGTTTFFSSRVDLSVHPTNFVRIYQQRYGRDISEADLTCTLPSAIAFGSLLPADGGDAGRRDSIRSGGGPPTRARADSVRVENFPGFRSVF